MRPSNPLNLRHLQGIVALRRTRSFGAAADEINLTQSALTQAVAAFEERIGRKLFERGARGSDATVAGNILANSLERALRTLDVEVRAAQRGERETLRIGVFQTAAAELVPAALRALGDRHPGVDVALVDCDRREDVVEELTHGRLDLAFAVDPEPHDGIEAIPLRKDSWVILTWRGSPLASAREPSLDLLDGVHVVAWNQHWQTQIELEEVWRRRGIAPRVVYRTDDSVVLQRLVAARLGHACVGRLLAERPIDASLTSVVPLEALPTRTIALCRARGRRLSAAVVALIEIVRAQTATGDR